MHFHDDNITDVSDPPPPYHSDDEDNISDDESYLIPLTCGVCKTLCTSYEQMKNHDTKIGRPNVNNVQRDNGSFTCPVCQTYTNCGTNTFYQHWRRCQRSHAATEMAERAIAASNETFPRQTWARRVDTQRAVNPRDELANVLTNRMQWDKLMNECERRRVYALGDAATNVRFHDVARTAYVTAYRLVRDTLYQHVDQTELRRAGLTDPSSIEALLLRDYSSYALFFARTTLLLWSLWQVRNDDDIAWLGGIGDVLRAQPASVAQHFNALASALIQADIDGESDAVVYEIWSLWRTLLGGHDTTHSLLHVAMAVHALETPTCLSFRRAATLRPHWTRLRHGYLCVLYAAHYSDETEVAASIDDDGQSVPMDNVIEDALTTNADGSQDTSDMPLPSVPADDGFTTSEAVEHALQAKNDTITFLTRDRHCVVRDLVALAGFVATIARSDPVPQVTFTQDRQAGTGAQAIGMCNGDVSIRIDESHLQAMMRGMIDEAATQADDLWSTFPGGIPRPAWLTPEEIRDSEATTRAGYCFVDDLNLVRRTHLRTIHEGVLSMLGVPTSEGPISDTVKTRCDMLLRQISAFSQALMMAIHFTSGCPSRVVDLLRVQVVNGDIAPRQLFIDNSVQRVAILTKISKTQRYAQNASSLRYLAPRVGRLALEHVAVFVPLARSLVTLLGIRRFRSCPWLVFDHRFERLETHRFSNYMAAATRRHLAGVELRVRGARQVLIFVCKHILGETFANDPGLGFVTQDGHLITDDVQRNEDEDEEDAQAEVLLTTHAYSAGHSTRTHQQQYGRTAGPDVRSQVMRQRILRSCHALQVWARVAQGVTDVASDEVIVERVTGAAQATGSCEAATSTMPASPTALLYTRAADDPTPLGLPSYENTGTAHGVKLDRVECVGRYAPLHAQQDDETIVTQLQRLYPRVATLPFVRRQQLVRCTRLILRADRHAICILPTGAGKTLCWSAAALLDGRPEQFTVLLVPYVALLGDIEAAGRTRSPARTLWSTLVEQEKHADPAALADVETSRVIVATYEQATSRLFGKFLTGLADAKACARIVLDEAHSFSEEANFRSVMAIVGVKLRVHAPHVACITLSGSLPPTFEASVVAMLQCRVVSILRCPTQRTEVAYAVRALHTAHPPQRLDDDAFQALVVNEIQRLRGIPVEEGGAGGPLGGTMIFCKSKERVDQISTALQCGKYYSTHYVNDTTDTADRDAMMKSLRAFLAGETHVIVGTTAIAAGLHRADVRLVISVERPYSLVSLVQQAGRAGRDGYPANAVVLTWNAATDASRKASQFRLSDKDTKVRISIAGLGLESMLGKAHDADQAALTTFMTAQQCLRLTMTHAMDGIDAPDEIRLPCRELGAPYALCSVCQERQTLSPTARGKRRSMEAGGATATTSMQPLPAKRVAVATTQSESRPRTISSSSSSSPTPTTTPATSSSPTQPLPLCVNLSSFLSEQDIIDFWLVMRDRNAMCPICLGLGAPFRHGQSYNQIDACPHVNSAQHSDYMRWKTPNAFKPMPFGWNWQCHTSNRMFNTWRVYCRSHPEFAMQIPRDIHIGVLYGLCASPAARTRIQSWAAKRCVTLPSNILTPSDDAGFTFLEPHNPTPQPWCEIVHVLLHNAEGPHIMPAGLAWVYVAVAAFYLDSDAL